MAEEAGSAGAGAAGRLREAAARLAAELDEARLYRAAAYASMAADAVAYDLPAAQREEETGTDIELDFTLDEQDRVWMIREGDCYILGRSDTVCPEMRRFLAGVVLGEGR